MRENLIIKYCDELLNRLNKLPKGESLNFSYQLRENPKFDMPDDILVSIGMPESYHDLCLNKLKERDFIQIWYHQDGKGYDVTTEQHIAFGIGKIYITDIGRHFITNNSFKKEGRNFRWKNRMPNTIAASATLISLASLIITYKQYKQQTLDLSTTKQELLTEIKAAEDRTLLHSDSVLKNHNHVRDTGH